MCAHVFIDLFSKEIKLHYHRQQDAYDNSYWVHRGFHRIRVCIHGLVLLSVSVYMYVHEH